ncbi:MAG: glycosyl hydrolase family 43, partial [Verrucomicrobia bacterium]|nr:glycosyl hydrolase family 43 [Verrucomicrobiota bacterium]
VGQHTVGNLTFEGELGEFRQFDRALTAPEIADLMQSMPLPPSHPRTTTVEMMRGEDGKLEARAWLAGRYALRTADGRNRRFEVNAVCQPLELAGPWDLSFPPKLGAPAQVTLKKLTSWSEHPDTGVRYFSGTATYNKTIDLPADWVVQNRRWYLDLGKVGVIAEVKLNGRNLGVLWKTPYRVEVTAAVKAGPNALEVKVVNLWVNRQIGDEYLPEDSERNPDGTLKQWPHWLDADKPSPTGRFTFATTRILKKEDSLAESGLLGPVTLHVAEMVDLK